MLKDKIGICFSFLIFISGCASTGFLMAKPEVTMFGNAYSPKNEEAKIDVYKITLICTVHEEYGFSNILALYHIIEIIQT